MQPMVFEIRFVVEPDDDGFHAFCPDLEGLHVDGDTFDAALECAKDAVEVHLKSLMNAGDPIPIGVLQEPGYEMSLSIFEYAFRKFSSRRQSCSSRVEQVRLEPAAA